MARTLIFGDVHGCADELEELLLAFAPTSDDRVVSVGDLFRKGPDSPRVGRTLRKLADDGPEVLHVLGNHEVYLRRVLRDAKAHSLERDLRVFVDSLETEDLDWLIGAPLHRAFPEFNAVVLHAGIMPHWSTLPPADTAVAEEEDPKGMDELVRVRSLSTAGVRNRVTKVRKNGQRGRTLLLAPDLPLPSPPSGGTVEVEEVEVPEGTFLGLREIGADDTNWPTIYDGRFGHVYFGHQPFLDDREAVDFPHATALDLGCVYGGVLAAVVLEEGEPAKKLSIAARREYSRWGFPSAK